MPWSVRKSGGNCAADKWAVVNKQTGRTMGCHDTKASANKQLAALNANTDESDPLAGGIMSKPLREVAGLMEAPPSIDAPARRTIQIITPGWGSSGYYSAQVLERAADRKVIPAGTHMYLNHASESDRSDRPERDVEKIGAVLVEDARWDGQRLTAPADLIGPHAELIESLAPYIGVSISGSATDITVGEAEGRTGPIIEDLAVVDSVDFVTRAGRGGMVLLESARPTLVTARAVSHGVTEATANETREQLQNALRDRFTGERVYVWVEDFDDSKVWFQHETPDFSGTYELAYTAGDEGAIALADDDPIEVIQKRTFVPATRSDSTPTTEVDQEVTMGKISVEESEHKRLVETAGRVDTLEAERDTEKTRADTAEQKLAEATAKAAEKGDPPAPAPSSPSNPRQVIETRLAAQELEIAQMRARERGRDIIAEELAEAWVATSTKARLSSDLIGDLPLVENKLDENGLRAKCVEARNRAELEAAETLDAAGYGTPRGLGGMTTPAVGNADRYDKDIAEGMQGAFGMSETEAAAAVKGR